ncbi:MAG TPA: hypothetical protein PLA27_11835 [Anaerolineales bacterium]|jgi:hypothetical protein|nr:hypothetical protein [Anaerolineales bacterium]
MNNFSTGQPRTIFDWAALRDEFRNKLELLQLETLSIMYGLSKTVGHQDDGFVNQVEEYLSKSKDPIRMRFDLAYCLGNTFWDYYEPWEFDNRQPEEPGYVGKMVDGFHDDLLAWVLGGLSAYSDDPEVMDSAFFLVSRIGNFDTFLNEEDIPLMESAAKKEISLETSPGGRGLVEIFRKFFAEQRGDNSGANRTQPEDDASGNSI